MEFLMNVLAFALGYVVGNYLYAFTLSLIQVVRVLRLRKMYVKMAKEGKLPPQPTVPSQDQGFASKIN